jgi:NitT/TauT family transport system substrate-binding protein
VRGIVRVQHMLRDDPARAKDVGDKRFPPTEAELIAELIERDVPYYEPAISEDTVVQMNQFAQKIGLLSKATPYDQVVATQFKELWVG